jgi:MFS family permease
MKTCPEVRDVSATFAKTLVYLCPSLMDWMVCFVSFAVFYAAGARGVGLQACGWLGLLYQAAYMANSLAAGHLVTRRNARRVLLASTLVCGASSSVSLCSTSFGPLAAGLSVFGMSVAWFFTSFQAVMRGEAAVGSLKTSVALYSLSWCLGAALGHVTAGGLYQWGLPALLAAVALATALIALTLRLTARRADQEPPPEAPAEQGSRLEYPVSNTYIIVGWLMIVTVTFVQRPLFAFLPPLFAADGVGSFWASLPLFMHMAVSAAFGLAMSRYRDYLYRRTPFLIIQGGGCAALCALWVWPTYWACFTLLCLLGVYAGFAYYCAVYYASNSGLRSLNIGVNEALVGLGSIAGIMLGDGWMRHSGSTSQLYLVCAAGLAVSTLAQLTLAFLKPARPGVEKGHGQSGNGMGMRFPKRTVDS